MSREDEALNALPALADGYIVAALFPTDDPYGTPRIYFRADGASEVDRYLLFALARTEIACLWEAFRGAEVSYKRVAYRLPSNDPSPEILSIIQAVEAAAIASVIVAYSRRDPGSFLRMQGIDAGVVRCIGLAHSELQKMLRE